MFGKNTQKNTKTMAKTINTETESIKVNQVSTGTTIKGEFSTNGDSRIDGNLIGNIKSEGKLIIGPKGSVDGEIVCKNAIVEGIIKGKARVAELISIKATAKVKGDIITEKIAIEPGAEFNGTCKMGNEASKPSYEQRPTGTTFKPQEKPAK